MSKKIDFEEALQRLEEITLKLENGNLSLDESLKFFEEGIKLSRVCEEKLLEVENKIKILTSTDINEDIVDKVDKKEENINQNKDSNSNKNIDNEAKKPKKINNNTKNEGILPF